MLTPVLQEICSWSPLDIALLLYFTLLSSTASIIQQIHDIFYYQDIRIEQFHRGRANPNDPEHAIANASFGMDLVLYYIRTSDRCFLQNVRGNGLLTVNRVLLVQRGGHACHVLVRPPLPSPPEPDQLSRWNLTFHRAFELAQSVYGLSAKIKWKPILKKINIAGKAFAILFPLMTILLLRIPEVKDIFILFILIADLPREYIPDAKTGRYNRTN